MKNVRWLAVGFGFGALLSLAPSCGAAWVCGPDSCTGCCSSSGACVGGTRPTACGSNGAACGTCDADKSCTAGVCIAQAPDAGNANSGADAGIDAGVDPVVDAGVDPVVDAGVLLPTNPLDFSAVITPDPARYGLNIIVVTIRGANGVLVPDATLTAKTWMALHGHGSATPTITNTGGGEYTVSKVAFTMYGDWTVTFTATSPSGDLSGTKVFSYTVN